MFPVFLVTALGNPSSLVVLFVQINNTVTDLNLRYNMFGDAGAIAISEALKVSFVFFRGRSPFSWLPPLPVTRSCTSTQANDTVANLTGCKLTTAAQTFLGRNNGLAVWRQRHNDTLAIEPGTVIGERGTAEFAKGVGKAIQVLSLVCSAFFFCFWSKPKSVCHLWRLVAGGSKCGAVNRAA